MSIRAKRKDSRPDEFLAGIPNTDLDEDVYQALSPEDRQRVRDSDLYTTRTDREMKEPVAQPRVAHKEGGD